VLVNDLTTELDSLLANSKGQLGRVATCIQQGKESWQEIVAAGAAANQGAVSNLRAQMATIRDGELPKAPTVARNTLSAVRSFRRQHHDVMSAEAAAHIETLIERLEDRVTSQAAQEAEEAELESESRALEDVVQTKGGVYVYSFPFFLRYPKAEDEAGRTRHYLKIGKSERDPFVRVREQAKTALPEDPVILRVYTHATASPAEIEARLHNALRAAQHDRTEKGGGQEWYVTTTDLTDAMAEMLGCEITAPSTE
jgi:hypothetical protein